MSTITTSAFSRTPQAQDDTYGLQATEGELESGGFIVLDVIANDLGGAAKTLYSVGSGVGEATVIMQELVSSDLTNVASQTDGYTALGAALRIVDGKVQISMGEPAYAAAITALTAGQVLDDSFVYAIRLGNGTLSWAKVTFKITGTNDVPVFGGVSTAALTEDASASVLTTGGSLTIVDADANQSTFAATSSFQGQYGTFTLTTNGAWTYSANNTQLAIQQLGAGQSLSDSFTAVSSDGTASTVVTVTINGTNDIPVIAGVSTAAVTEDASTPNLTAVGALTITDADAGQSTFIAQPSAAGSYGVFTLAADGAWTYSASNDQAAIQQLGADQSITDSFTAVSSDGSASQIVTVTINGTNDVPVIGGVSTAAVAEDSSTPSLTTSGTLTIADVDAGESTFTAQANAAGTYGSFTLAASGAWTYSASNAQAAIQQLGAGQSITDSFTAVSSDGTASQLVTVTINGTNDVPIIGGASTAAVAEDASTPNLTAGGTLTIADVDAGQSTFTSQANATGTYGSFTLAANGAWTYSASNAQAAVQQLGAGQSITDSFTAVSLDGTASQVVTVTINGTNDVPVIGGVATSAVTEDAATPNLTTGGILTIADVDAGESTFTAQANAAGTYGSFTLAASGAWTYSASNAQVAIQRLGAGQSITDSFTAVSSDGSASQIVTVTINGTNDVPVIGGVSTAAVAEDASTPNLTAGGTLTIADVDAGQSTFTSQANATGTYGSFTLAANGAWTYSASNAQVAIQQLGAGQSITDSFTAVSLDGSASQIVTVTINGTNDVPVIGGVSTATVTEDASTPHLTTGGSLTIADVDAGESTFTSQAGFAGTYGSFTLAANGDWTYSASNAQVAIQRLGAGQSITDSFTAVSSDGSASQVVTVTINGTNDVPVIGGVSTAAVAEDASTPNLTAGGTLTIADVDAGQSTFTSQANATGTYGSFTLAANGAWTYSASNAQTAIQQLGAGQSITDSFTAVSLDGTASQMVTVTINGTNDVPVIGGVATSAVTEDAATPNLATGGILTIADVDAGESTFTAQANAAGTYGSFTLTANGAWTYSASNAQAAVQQLGAGQSITDSFTAVSLDGTASQMVTVTINGTNDVPVIGGVATSAVTEDAATPNLTTGGILTIADVDAGESTFTAQANAAGTYGIFTLAASGAWTYSASNAQAAIQQLGAGQSLTDSFTAVSSDGTASQVVTVTINGTNDVPVIGGVSTADVAEDSSAPNLTTGGTLTIADVDAGESTFTAQANATGTYGSFTLAANGQWSYSASNAQAAIQQLGTGQSLTDSFTAVSSDGTASQLVTVTINGTNDVPVIGGVSTAAVTEDATTPNLTTSGTLTIVDVDSGESSFKAQTNAAGTYGAFTLAADGAWTYSASNAQAAIQQLGAGQSLTDSFTAVSFDGTASQVVTVTINGTNDAPVIGGVSTSAVTEDASAPTLTTGGALTITDVDAGESTFKPQPGAVGTYGSFTLAADGAWTYSASNAQAAIQQLGAGQSLTDSFTAVSFDGTDSQLVTVTINGTNDVPVVGGVSTSAVTEDASAPNLATGGTLTIADVDSGESSFKAQTNAAGTYGAFTLAADGAWTYSASNAQTAIQRLGAGQSLTESFTAVSFDGTASQLVTVTINGTNDVPVIGGGSTAAVTEDATTPNLTTSGTLTIADVDAGESTFKAQANAAGTYGAFTLAADGAWTYTASTAQAAIQQLGAGQSLTDSFAAVSFDGTASQLVTVTINGTNDVPVIAGVSTSAVTEDASAPHLTAGGTLTIADVDAGESTFLPQASFAGTYGAFTLDAAGAWTYTASNNQIAVQQLGAGQSIIDSFTAVSSDGTASQVVTVTINGTNDSPVIGGVSTAAVTEDVASPNLTTGGALTIADADVGQSTFVPQASFAGTYGAFTLGAAGAWTYTASNNQVAVQQLGAGQSIIDSFTAGSSDGTASQVVTVTISGTNDSPVIGGVSTASVTEDVASPNLTTGGTLTIADADAGQATFAPQASFAGTHGSFTLAAAGNWSYVASNAQSSIQQLGAGQSLTDTFTAVSQDGTGSQVVTVTINGANDIATISYAAGQNAGALTEDSTATISGSLTVADADAGEAVFAALAAADLNKTYGTFTFNAATGAWTYALDNSRPEVQALAAGQKVIDALTVASRDGTDTETITVTITGAADGPANVAVDDLVYVSAQTSSIKISFDALMANDLVTAGADIISATLVQAGNISALTVDPVNRYIGFNSANGSADATIQYALSGGDIGLMTVRTVQTTPSNGNGDSVALSGSYAASYIDLQNGEDSALSSTAGSADDVFIGGGGNDTLSGGTAHDILHGGVGNDVLTGGAGADTFVFDTQPHTTDNFDRIADFDASTDTILLAKSVFAGFSTAGSSTGTTLLASDYTEVASGGATATIGTAHIVYDAATGNLFYDADGGGAAGRTLFAVLDNKPLLTTMDFNDFKVGT
jgi:VCBS repeat-containing protein